MVNLICGTVRHREEHLFITWNSVPAGSPLGSVDDGVQSMMAFYL